jgi:hypothetical protein
MHLNRSFVDLLQQFGPVVAVPTFPAFVQLITG